MKKTDLKPNVQKTKNVFGIRFHHFMANRWRNNGNRDRLLFLGSKITANGNCSHEIKRCLLLGRKAMTNIDSILKSRDINLPTKVCIVNVLLLQKQNASKLDRCAFPAHNWANINPRSYTWLFIVPGQVGIIPTALPLLSI